MHLLKPSANCHAHKERNPPTPEPTRRMSSGTGGDVRLRQRLARRHLDAARGQRGALLPDAHQHAVPRGWKGTRRVCGFGSPLPYATLLLLAGRFAASPSPHRAHNNKGSRCKSPESHHHPTPPSLILAGSLPLLVLNSPPSPNPTPSYPLCRCSVWAARPRSTHRWS